MGMNVKDRVVIVTGSGSGIGKEILKRLTEHGAKGVVVDMNREASDEAWYITGQVLHICGGKSLGIYGH